MRRENIGQDGRIVEVGRTDRIVIISYDKVVLLRLANRQAEGVIAG